MDFCVILLIFSIFLAGAQKLNAYPFEDVSAFANLDHSMGPTAKYGGASIADLNSDGYPDLMFGHHDQSPVEIYINNQDGTFSKVKNFNVKFDAHGINPFRFSRWSPNLHVSISRGGSFGKKFGCPQIFYVESEGREHRWQLLNTMRIEDTLHRDSLTRSPQLHLNRFGRMTSPNFESSEEADELDDSKSETNGTFNSHNMKPLVSIINVTDHINAQYGKGRGRSALFMNLRSKHYASTDAIFINARAMQKFNGVMERNHQKAMRGVKGGRFEEEQLKGFSQNKNWYATYGDLTNNGRIDVISFQRLKIHRVADDFKLRDMTDRLLPSNLQREGVVAVSVLDYNNDLKWDMYLARTNTGDLQWIWKMKHFHDYLLRFSEFDEQPNSSNKSRRFEDVSIEANIPRGWNTRGVTSGDFDNDGWIDILISRYDAPDLLLWNNGNGTFNAVDAGFNRTEGVPGDMVTAGKLQSIFHFPFLSPYIFLIFSIVPSEGNSL